jgi:hypothetical protein
MHGSARTLNDQLSAKITVHAVLTSTCRGSTATDLADYRTITDGFQELAAMIGELAQRRRSATGLPHSRRTARRGATQRSSVVNAN